MPARNMLRLLLVGVLALVAGLSEGTIQAAPPSVIVTIPVGGWPWGVAVNPSTNHVYVTDHVNNIVSVIDGTTDTVLATVPVGTSPRGVAVNSTTNLIYVANASTDNVSVIDGRPGSPTENTVISTLAVGDYPRGVAINSTTNRIYVTNRGSGSVSVINGQTNAVVTTVLVGLEPYGVATNRVTNRIYVANESGNSVSVIDGVTNGVLATISVGVQPRGVAVNADTNRIYVANWFNDTVSVINGATNAVIATVSVGDRPQGVAIYPITNRIYVANGADHSVSVIDGETNTVMATVAVGNGPWDIAVNPDTRRIYVPNNSGATVSVMEDPTDWDDDGLPDLDDNCRYVYNPDQKNTDAAAIDNGPVVTGDDITAPNGDILGDVCDPDIDNDWMLNTGTHPIVGTPGEDEGCDSGPTNPSLQDTDGDKVIDGAECLLGSDPNDSNSTPSCSGFTDNDSDCLPADVEPLFGSSDDNVQTDGDGISDPIEVMGWGTSPASTDTDGDSSGNDGCQDDKEIVSVNDDTMVDSGDVLIIRQRAVKVKDDDFDPDPPWNFSPAFDLNKDGYIDSGDMLLVRKNSGAVEPHDPCP